eukprot:TRINITY_DN41388_c0_g1_i3.p1 TRINITY_DN41388_c0_g1~~TRINITY_DN41388_c0_g1_i3.p1  ORF type:complete len:389 (+),score=59.77 TRINITY_DN41388_c0_g1_i3:147-1169(+)
MQDMSTVKSLKQGDVICVSGYIMGISTLQASQVTVTSRSSIEESSFEIQPSRAVRSTTSELYPKLPVIMDYDVPKSFPELWEHMFANLEQYWDMRDQNAEDNRGDRSPSFVHKTLKQRGLWMDEDLPQEYEQWIAEGKVPVAYPGWKLLREKPSEFWRKSKNAPEKAPSFVHKATQCGIWYHETEASQEQTQFMKAISSPDFEGEKPQDPWEDLFEHPEHWKDIRLSKTNPRAPDFRDALHPNGVALWLDSADAGVLERLEEMKDDLKFVKDDRQKEEEDWASLIEKPELWIDFRKQKLDGKVKDRFPDFKSKDKRKALWIDSRSIPSWALDKLPDIPSQ